MITLNLGSFRITLDDIIRSGQKILVLEQSFSLPMSPTTCTCYCTSKQAYERGLELADFAEGREVENVVVTQGARHLLW